MIKHIRNRETGKYEFREVVIPCLRPDVLSLVDGEYEFRRHHGFNKFTVRQQFNCIVISNSHTSFYFSKLGEFNMAIRNARLGKEAERLNINFEENLDVVQTVIKILNDPSTTIL